MALEGRTCHSWHLRRLWRTPPTSVNGDGSCVKKGNPFTFRWKYKRAIFFLVWGRKCAKETSIRYYVSFFLWKVLRLKRHFLERYIYCKKLSDMGEVPYLTFNLNGFAQMADAIMLAHTLWSGWMSKPPPLVNGRILLGSCQTTSSCISCKSCFLFFVFTLSDLGKLLSSWWLNHPSEN